MGRRPRANGTQRAKPTAIPGGWQEIMPQLPRPAPLRSGGARATASDSGTFTPLARASTHGKWGARGHGKRPGVPFRAMTLSETEREVRCIASRRSPAHAHYCERRRRRRDWTVPTGMPAGYGVGCKELLCCCC